MTSLLEEDRPQPEATRPGLLRRYWWTPLVLGVVAVGVVLRFASTPSLWLDEAQSVAIARLPLPHLLTAVREDGSPPLYYLVLHFWMGIFGTSDWAVRSLSGVCALAALPLLYRLASRWGRGAAVATVTLAAVNPWVIRYATEARPYAMEVLVVLLGLVALEGVARRPGPPPAGLLALATGLVLLTHYWALYLYAAAAAALLVAYLYSRAPWLRWAMGGLAVGPVLFLPWVPSFLYQLHHTGTPWAGKVTMGVLPRLVGEWGYGPSGPPWAPVLILVIWPLMVWAAVTGGHRAKLFGAVLVATVALAVLAAERTGSAVLTRYTAVVVPLALLLLGLGLSRVPVVWRAGLAVVLVVVWVRMDVAIAHTSRTQAGQVAAAINQHATPADTVVFCPDQLGPGVVRQLRVQPKLVSYPQQQWPGRMDWTDYVHRVDTQSPTKLGRQVAAAQGRSGSVWMVANYWYHLIGNRCRSLKDSLSKELGKPQLVVALRHTGGEHEMLWRWRK